MAIIHQYDKRSGITYAYESHSYWDKEKKTSRAEQSRAKRTLIGRVNTDTGEIVPTDGRCRKDKSRNVKGKAPDYKELYEKLERKYMSQELLISVLQKELVELKEKAQHV
jgi:hypothetical protein